MYLLHMMAEEDGWGQMKVIKGEGSKSVFMNIKISICIKRK